MAEPARIQEEPLDTTDAKPLLHVVRDPVTEEAPEEPMPNLGRTALLGYGVGFLVSIVVFTVAGTLSGLGFGPSLGLGAFVGVWGGGGFGFLIGGTVPLVLHLDDQHARSPDLGQGEAHGPATR